MSEAKDRTIALNVRLKPSESSAHPRHELHQRRRGSGIAYLDFGFIEATLLAAITKTARMAHLGHRPARFPREPDRLGLKCVGTLTSRCVWHDDRQSHHSPTYGGVYEIREGSKSLLADRG